MNSSSLRGLKMTIARAGMVLAVALSASACSSDPVDTTTKGPQDSTATSFKDATLDELLWSAYAAMGAQGFDAYRLATIIDAESLSQTDCPSAEVDGKSTRYDATGCTSDGGYDFNGTLEAVDLPASPGGPTPHLEPFTTDGAFSLTYTKLDASAGEAAVFYDGSFVQEAPNAGISVRINQLWASLELPDTEPVAFGSSVETHCTEDMSSCAFAEGSWGEVDGLGSFQVSGEFGLDESGDTTGYLELRGADLLTVDLEGTGELCWNFSVDEQDVGLTCVDTNPHLPPSGGGGGPGGDQPGNATGSVTSGGKGPAINLKSGVAYTHQVTGNTIVVLTDWPDTTCDINTDWDKTRPNPAVKIELDLDAPKGVPGGAMYASTPKIDEFIPQGPLQAEYTGLTVDLKKAERVVGEVAVGDFPKGKPGDRGTVAFSVPYCGVHSPPPPDQPKK